MSEKKRSPPPPYVGIGKMTHIPKNCKWRGWGWFYHRPGIRFLEDRVDFDTYKRSIPDFAGYHLCDKCHIVMCIEEEIVPREAGVQLLRGLREMEKDGIDEARRKAGGIGHSGEAYLIQKLGWEIGGYINVGRSSHDLFQIHNRVMQRDALLDIMDGVNDLRETLLDISDKHLETLIPEYTALQHARIHSLAFQLTSFVKMLERDFERLELCYKHTNVSPIGIAGSGSDFPLNTHRTALLGGFDETFDNAYDAWEAYDYRAETYAVVGMIGDVLARIGAYLTRLCTYEYGMAELADRFCGTSSIFPGKKNPGSSILIDIGFATRHISLLDEGGRLGNGSGGNPKYFEEAVSCIMNGLRWARDILETATFYTKRMNELCNYGFMCNPELCRVVMEEKGLPWRTIHQIVSLMTRKAREKGWEMADVTAEFLDECAIEYVGYGRPLNLSEEKLREAFNPEVALKNLKSPGGPAPQRVKEQIARSRQRLKRDRSAVIDKRDKLKAAADKLEKTIDALIE